MIKWIYSQKKLRVDLFISSLISFLYISVYAQKTWVTQQSGTNSALRAITWSGSKFIAVGDSGTVIVSPDGKKWKTEPTVSKMKLNCVYANDSIRIAAGDSECIMLSIRNASWKNRDTIYDQVSPASQHHPNCCAIVNTGKRFVMAAKGTSVTYVSTDGSKWTKQYTGMSLLNDLLWSGSMLIAIGNGDVIRNSSDGITWEENVFENSAKRQSITQFGDECYIASSTGEISVLNFNSKSDPEFWDENKISLNPPNTKQLWGIAASDSLIVAVGDTGTILVSNNGSNWRREQSNITTTLADVTFGKGLFVAVGDSGIILTAENLRVSSKKSDLNNNSKTSVLKLQINNLFVILKPFSFGLVNDNILKIGLFSLTGSCVFNGDAVYKNGEWILGQIHTPKAGRYICRIGNGIHRVSYPIVAE